MKKIIFLLLISVLCNTIVFAQKVKYKDLYALLRVKKYQDAEPFLKLFLQDEKNFDHANAHLQMAFLQNEKLSNDDILKETDALINHIDSAILYYEKAQKLIDEKEIKKNDEYYVSYQRRDVRTGKFGINLADVQFDIEEKIKVLKTRKNTVDDLSLHFENFKNAYDSSQIIFKSIKLKFPSYKVLILRSNEEEAKLLNEVEIQYDLALENFEKFKPLLARMGKSNYQQQLEIKTINDYDKDGVTEANYYNDKVAIWNYKDWKKQAVETQNTISNAVLTDLVNINSQLLSFSGQLKNSNDPKIKEIPTSDSAKNLTDLNRIDDKPLPVLIIDYNYNNLLTKIKEIELSKHIDSADVDFQRKELLVQQANISNIDSILNLITSKQIDEEVKNYSSFINSQFENAEGFRAFLTKQKLYVAEAKEVNSNNIASNIEQSIWLVNESDSIPLYKMANRTDLNYFSISNDSILTTGLFTSEKQETKGYLAQITPSRVLNMKLLFDVDTSYFRMEKLDEIKSLTLLDDQIDEPLYLTLIYATTQSENGTYPAHVFEANKEGIIWQNDIELINLPLMLEFDSEGGTLAIRLKENLAMQFDDKGELVH